MTNRSGVLFKKSYVWKWVLARRNEMSSALGSKEESDSFESRKVKSFDEIPAVPKVPIIGAYWAYLPIIGKYNVDKMDDARLNKFEEFGKISREDFTKRLKFVHLFDVKDIETVFRNEGKFPQTALLSLKMYRESNKELYGNGGLFATHGQKWYDVRTKVQPHLLKPKSVHDYQPQLDTVASELVDKIRLVKNERNEVSDLMSYLEKWAVESISLMALETKLNCLSEDLLPDSDASIMINAAKNLLRDLSKMEFSRLKLWRFFPTPTKRRFTKSMDVFSSISLKYIREAKARMEADSNPNRQGKFLEMILQKENMGESEVTSLVMDFFLAGIDTSSNSVAFTLYHLAKNPTVQEKVFQEVCRVLPNVQDQLKPEHLNELSYLKACAKESARLNPVISTTTRRLTEDLVLSGYYVPAGVIVQLHTKVPSRLEENFKDADKYQPERWLRGENVPKINQFASIPFGLGVKSCVGRRLAEQKIWTLLTRILRNYKVEYDNEEVGVLSRLINHVEEPLRFRFIDRE